MHSKWLFRLLRLIMIEFHLDKKKSLKRNKIVVPAHNQSKPKKVKTETQNGNAKEKKEIKVKEVHSIEEGKNMFQWIMDGINVDEFMK